MRNIDKEIYKNSDYVYCQSNVVHVKKFKKLYDCKAAVTEYEALLGVLRRP